MPIIPENSLPNHIAIIMDGNGTWGKKHEGKRTAGHKKGAEVMGEITNAIFDLKIPFVSFYAFSVDNWNRSTEEVTYLHNLMKAFYKNDFPKYQKKNYKILVSGLRSRLEKDILTIIDDITDKTKNNTAGTVNICFNYGGRTEIVNATKAFCEDVLAGRKTVEDLTTENFHEYFFAKEVPSVDLMIRTSGEKRLSDFLLYQNAYAEFYFTDVLWPDFTVKDLNIALEEYKNRNRRFGKE